MAGAFPSPWSFRPILPGQLRSLPLVVEEGAQPTNVTLLIDVTTWFVALDGSLIDPRTAGNGGPNEGLVEDNIRASIDGFEDEDEDGEDDDDDQDDD